MKENHYDDPTFFEKYQQMDRSQKGLSGAGEWATLEPMLPDFRGKRVLDLGCGFGWHCVYAVEHGAASAVGIDISQKMIQRAIEKNARSEISYHCMPVEDYEFSQESFDIVLSSLAFHYLEEIDPVFESIHRTLKPGGRLIFSVEHPIFTCHGTQDWFYGPQGEILHFPVDRYFSESRREACFLGERVVKFHRTLQHYLGGLLQAGFSIEDLAEPQPTEQMLREIPGIEQELRRPMMLIISAKKRD